LVSLTRRRFIAQAPLAAGALVCGRSRFGIAQPEKAVVEIAHGKLCGRREDGVAIFKGIPYGGRVSGRRRFLAPSAVQPWKGVRDALRLGPPAIQPGHQTYGIDEPAADEECLVLNIWTPALDDGKRPVMFYNHGGGYTSGSGGSVAQDGANLARLFDVVVVQTNHRLGLLGFLYLDEVAGEEYIGSGCRGVLDIVEGLKWVHDNIACFGGDPDNVMIFGESGGGGKTSCLFAMPAAAPYFHKASIESGPGVRMAEPDVAAETTWMLLNEFGLTVGKWRRLLDIPAADLLAVQLRLQQKTAHARLKRTLWSSAAGLGEFGPVVDGKVLPAHPFDPVAPEISRHKPLMVGWNEDEFTFFAMAAGDTAAVQLDQASLLKRVEAEYGPVAGRMISTYRRTRPQAFAGEIYVAIRSMDFSGIGSLEIASKKAGQKGAPAFLYQFGYQSEFRIPGTEYALGACHAMDILFKFANVVPPPAGELEKGWPGNRPQRFAAARNMAGMWTTFARCGKPAAQGQPEWPAYTLAGRPSMRIDHLCEVFFDRYREEREMWEEISQQLRSQRP